MNPQPSSPARAKRNTIAPWGAVLFLLWSTGAFPQTAYERFRQAWDAEGTGQLQQLVQPGVKDVPPCVHLLTEAALACRLSDDRNALLLLDSLEQAACRTEWPIRAAGLKLRSSLLIKLGDPESGLVTTDKGLGLLKGKPFPDERVDLMVIRSEALMVLDRFDDAMAQLVPAQRTVDSTGYGKGGALVHFSIGSIHFHQGRYSDAWQDFRAAYTLAGASGAHYLAMNALSNLAGTAIMQKDHTLALDLFDSVLQRPSGISPEVLAQARTQRPSRNHCQITQATPAAIAAVAHRQSVRNHSAVAVTPVTMAQLTSIRTRSTVAKPGAIRRHSLSGGANRASM